jgi:hypothetical protein
VQIVEVRLRELGEERARPKLRGFAAEAMAAYETLNPE